MQQEALDIFDPHYYSLEYLVLAREEQIAAIDAEQAAAAKAKHAAK